MNICHMVSLLGLDEVQIVDDVVISRVLVSLPVNLTPLQSDWFLMLQRRSLEFIICNKVEVLHLLTELCSLLPFKVHLSVVIPAVLLFKWRVCLTIMGKVEAPKEIKLIMRLIKFG